MDTYSAFYKSFMTVQRKFNKLEKSARDFGTGELLYPLEIHVIDTIGKNDELKMFELVKKLEITKGAVSQVVKKLVTNGYVIKFHEEGNSRDIYLKLRSKGSVVFNEHSKLEKQIIERTRGIITQIPAREINLLIEGFRILEEEFDKYLK